MSSSPCHHLHRHTHVVLWCLFLGVFIFSAALVDAKGTTRASRRSEKKAGASLDNEGSLPSMATLSPSQSTLFGAVQSPNTMLVVLCTALLTLLVVGTIIGVVATCLLVRLLRRDRVRSRQDDYPMLPYSPDYGTAHAIDNNSNNTLNPGDTTAPFLQVVAQQYATATPAQRYQLAQLFSSAALPSSSSHRSTTAGGDVSLSRQSSSSHVSPLSTRMGASSPPQHDVDAHSYSLAVTAAAAAAASPPPALLSNTTAPPLQSSSVDVSVENTPGHLPQRQPGVANAGRSPMLLGQRALHGVSSSPTDARGASGVNSQLAQVPAFRPTTTKDEDVLNTTRESRYNLVRRIGDGAFSSVYLVTRKSDGCQFAMKYMVCLNDRERATALRECEIMHTVQGHPNVIQIADMFMSFQFRGSSGAAGEAATARAGGDVAGGSSVSVGVTGGGGGGVFGMPQQAVAGRTDRLPHNALTNPTGAAQMAAASAPASPVSPSLWARHHHSPESQTATTLKTHTHRASHTAGHAMALVPSQGSTHTPLPPPASPPTTTATATATTATRAVAGSGAELAALVHSSSPPSSSMPGSAAMLAESFRAAGDSTRTPMESPTERVDGWLSSALPPHAAAKAQALLNAAEAARGTVNLTDLFRELASATTTTAAAGAGESNVAAPAPIGDASASDPSAYGQLEGGFEAWRGENRASASVALPAVDMDDFILSETDTERLMQAARMVRQRRVEYNRRHSTSRLPQHQQQQQQQQPQPQQTYEHYSPAGVNSNNAEEEKRQRLVTPLNGASVTTGGGTGTAITGLDESARVTPYAELIQQIAASSAQGTSSGSSANPPRGSGHSSPGLHSYRSSNRSSQRQLQQQLQQLQPQQVSGCEAADEMRTPRARFSPAGAAMTRAGTIDGAAPSSHPPSVHALLPPPAAAVAQDETMSRVTDDWWNVVDRSRDVQPISLSSSPCAAVVGGTKLTPTSYAPMTHMIVSPGESDPIGRPAVPRALSSSSADSAVSSTGGLAEEPLQPVYRNAMLYAAAGAMQQRREAAAAGVTTSTPSATTSSHHGKIMSGSEHSFPAHWQPPEDPTGTALAAAAAAAAGTVASPVRYTGLVHNNNAVMSDAAAPMSFPRSPTTAVPPPRSRSTSHYSPSTTPPQPLPIPVPVNSYAPVQYRNLGEMAPMHYSNFMTPATSSGALHELLGSGEGSASSENLRRPTALLVGGEAGCGDEDEDGERDEEDVENLDVETPHYAPAPPRSPVFERRDNATTVGQAIRFARAGQMGECMHTNDGKPHVAQDVLQRLPSYAPVSMAPGLGAALPSPYTSGLHAAGAVVATTQEMAETQAGPVFRRPNMAMPSYLDMFNGPMAMENASVVERHSPSTAAAVSALKATATSTNTTSTITAAARSQLTAGPTLARCVSSSSSALFSPAYGPSRPAVARATTTATGAPTTHTGSHTFDTNSSRYTAHSHLSLKNPQQQQQLTGLASSSRNSSSVMQISTPTGLVARHGGYLCLVMAYHAMGDLSRYVLRNQHVLETEARHHQQQQQRLTRVHSAATTATVTATTTTTVNNTNNHHDNNSVNSSASTSRLGSPADGLSHRASARSPASVRASSPAGLSSVQSNSNSLFFEPRPAGAGAAGSEAAAMAKPGSLQGKSSTAATHTRSAGLTNTNTTGTSFTVNSASHTSSSARSASVSPANAGASAARGAEQAAAAPRPVTYATLLDLSATDPTALNPLSEPQLLSIAYQIASVLRHLHAQNPPIVHRDLKPENILIKGDPHELLAEVLDTDADMTTAAAKGAGSGGRPGNAFPRGGGGDMPEDEEETEVIDLDAGEGEAGRQSSPYSPTSTHSCTPHSPLSASSQYTLHRASGSYTNNNAATRGGGHGERTLANTRTLHKIIPIVVTDFGLSMIQDSNGRGRRSGRGGGTRPYIAPESWKGFTSTASDVWGYGCVLYALATGRLTARTVRIMSDEARHDGFASMVLNDILSRRYSLAFASFVVSLLVVDPAKRPTAVMAERCFLVTSDEVRFDASSPFFSNVLDL